MGARPSQPTAFWSAAASDAETRRSVGFETVKLKTMSGRAESSASSGMNGLKASSVTSRGRALSE
jgi:hypothetical protein